MTSVTDTVMNTVMNTATSDILVSVIVPVYRTERTVERCVDSILAQSHKALDVLLIDDGSPDSCPRLCDRMAQGDARIRVIHQPNKGLSEARNTGVNAARGRFVAFVDSDDTVAPDFIASMLAVAADADADLVLCGFAVERHGGIVRLPGLSEPMEPRRFMRYMFTQDDHIPRFSVAWNKLYERGLCERVPFPAGRLYEDSATYFRFVDQARRIAFVNRPLYFYTDNADGIMRRRADLRAFDGPRASLDQTAFLIERGYDPDTIWVSMRQLALDCAHTASAMRKHHVAGWRAHWRVLRAEALDLSAQLGGRAESGGSAQSAESTQPSGHAQPGTRISPARRAAFRVAICHPLLMAAALRAVSIAAGLRSRRASPADGPAAAPST